MATILNSGLYPPIVETFLPSFVVTEEEDKLKIYFQVSPFMNINNVKEIHMCIKNQKGNNNLYKLSGIKAISKNDFWYDNEKGLYCFYIHTLKSKDSHLLNDFVIGEFYQIQLRFSKVCEKNKVSEYIPSEDWLAKNTEHFSEWSTVCLVKRINQPVVELQGLEPETKRYIASSFRNIRGNIKFFLENNQDEDPTEFLRTYQIKLKDLKNNVIVYDSGNKYDVSTIDEKIKYELQEGIVYRLYLSYETNNCYSDTYYYDLRLVRSTDTIIDAAIQLELDQDYGRIKVKIRGLEENYIGKFVIKRSSSKDNFTYWEEVDIDYMLNPTSIKYDFNDYTVEAGVWYQYAVCAINTDGEYGVATKSRKILADFEDAFLIGENRILRLSYNINVSDYKRNVVDSKTDTIGSKYAFFSRNAYVNYKSFSLSGLVSSMMDPKNEFYSKDKAYGKSILAYQKYNNGYEIADGYDYFYEKMFREEVLDFLSDGKPKLFKSLTEGNMLVRLMDVSLAPKQELGRLLCDFNSTVYELDDCTFDNYIKYNIYSNDVTQKTIEDNTSIKTKQIEPVFTDNTKFNVIDEIKKNLKISLTLTYEVPDIKWIRITFNGEPKIYKDDASQGLVLDSYASDALIGHKITINNKDVFVSKSYELFEEDLQNTDLQELLIYKTDSNCLIEYSYVSKLKESNNNTEDISNNSYIYNMGLLQCVLKDISSQYDICEELKKVAKSYGKTIVAINSIEIESYNNDAFIIIDAEDYSLTMTEEQKAKVFRHEVGPSGVLSLYDSSKVFKEIKWLEQKSDYVLITAYVTIRIDNSNEGGQ